MLGISFGELSVILLIALLVLDPKKIPEIGNKLGKMIREWKNIKSGWDQQIKSALDEPNKNTQNKNLPNKNESE